MENFTVAPYKGIPIPESGNFLLVESRIQETFSYGILGFGIQNTVQGIRNQVPGIRNPWHGIQSPKLSWIPFHRVIRGKITSSCNVLFSNSSSLKTKKK